MEPILKWAGGKRQLISELSKYVSRENLERHTYYEPFVGGGALFLYLAPKKAVINDVNSELICMYETIRDFPKELIKKLKEFKANYPDNYEEIRSLDRQPDFSNSDRIIRAARFIYLNKTCYNGLYRVNSQGFFNVPIGKYVNPSIVNESKIFKLSEYLKNNKIKITNVDFEESICSAKKGDVVYFDPPYDYEETGFTTYSSDGFNHEDLIRLKSACDRLIKSGCTIIVSNNDTKFVNSLFVGPFYEIHHVEANRFISCNGETRKKAKEVIIYGKQI